MAETAEGLPRRTAGRERSRSRGGLVLRAMSRSRIQRYDDTMVNDVPEPSQRGEQPSTAETDEALRRLGQYALSLTVRLVRPNSRTGLPDNRGTGFFVEKHGRTFLVSAAHGLRDGAWTIETERVRGGREMVQLRVPTVTLLHSYSVASAEETPIDLAWTELDVRSIVRDLNANRDFTGPNFSVALYGDTLGDRPNAEGLYVFAALNQAVFSGHARVGVEYGLTFEGMEYEGIEEREPNRVGCYRFKLLDPHLGNEAYGGSSGAPIVDAGNGHIVSLVLGGNQAQNVIWGLPLAEYERTIGLVAT